MPDTLILRPATPADASQAAPLLRAASPILFDRLFGPTPAETSRFFETLFAWPANPFSHEIALVAERDGQALGLALAAPVPHRRRLARRMFWLLPRVKGMGAALRLLPTVRDLGPATSTPPREAYYLSILSVRADVRDQGLGSHLLAEMERRARAAHCGCVYLHAELGNAGARRFYERHGFQTVGEHPSPRAARWGLAGFAALRKEV